MDSGSRLNRTSASAARDLESTSDDAVAGAMRGVMICPMQSEAVEGKSAVSLTLEKESSVIHSSLPLGWREDECLEGRNETRRKERAGDTHEHGGQRKKERERRIKNPRENGEKENQKQEQRERKKERGPESWRALNILESWWADSAFKMPGRRASARAGRVGGVEFQVAGGSNWLLFGQGTGFGRVIPLHQPLCFRSFATAFSAPSSGHGDGLVESKAQERATSFSFHSRISVRF